MNIEKQNNLLKVEIFIDDLKPNVQKELLKAMNLNSPEEGNLDIFPLFTIEIETR